MKYRFYRKYIDEWGEIWVKISWHKVLRISDGNIGGWFNGEGLKLASNQALGYTINIGKRNDKKP